MKPHCAPLFPPVLVGGNLARRIVAQMKVTMLARLPIIRGQRRPKWSMRTMQRNSPRRAMTELIAW